MQGGPLPGGRRYATVRSMIAVLTVAATVLFAVDSSAQTQPDTAGFDRLRQEATRLSDEGRTAEAEPAWRAALAAGEKIFDDDDPRLLLGIDRLASALSTLDRLDEAEPFYRRALALRERAAEPDHAALATNRNDLALVLEGLRRGDEAEALYRRALASADLAWPDGSRGVATILANLASLLDDAARFDEAEQLLRRAIPIFEAVADVDGEARALNDLAIVLEHTNRLEEAAQVHRRSIAIAETTYPPDDPRTAASLSNLATVLYHLERFREAEALNRRVLEMRRRTLPPDDPDIARALSNLAMVAEDRAEAEDLLREALDIRERTLPTDHPDIATSLNNLALHLDDALGLGEKEQLYRRALDIRRRALPPDHPRIAQSIANLASTLDDLGQDEEARRLQLEALAMYRRTLPPSHPSIATSLGMLAWVSADLGDYRAALAFRDEANRIRAAPENRTTIATHDWRYLAELRLRDAEALRRREGDGAAAVVREATLAAFADLQQAGAGGTGGAVAAAAARAQASDPQLDRLARERDRGVAEIAGLDAAFLAVSSDQSLTPEERSAKLGGLRRALDEAGRRLDDVVRDIADLFPAYADLAQSTPARIEELQPLLHEDEALIFVTPYRDAGFLFAVTRDADMVAALPGTDDAAGLARRLRCSAAARLDPACGAVLAQPGTRGAVSLAGGAATPDVFDMDLAHDLYRRLFPEQVRAFVEGRRLVIVPAPELMSLPWHLLLTQPPPAGWDAPPADRAALYREAAWLFRSHPSIAVLPSVSSLRALRGRAAPRPSAGTAYLGMGDPAIGRTAAERNAPPMDCGGGEVLLAAANPAARAAVAGIYAVFADGRDAGGFALADADRVRGQPRLADTRCEIERVAASLARGGERTELLFGADASETRVKDIDEAGGLAAYGILHFATHGLVGGELGNGEPGLLLTPPPSATARDDGVLTASEIATLTLDADWVILSACNTAAGSQTEADALSGLAKSFFYAGARSLLVSSWPVYSPAAVRITTAAFDAMAADPALGRAEALGIAMRRTLAAATDERTAHPSYWAPFLLVGEGAR